MKHLQIRFNDIENEKAFKLEATPEELEKLGFNSKVKVKPSGHYIIEYLGDKKIFKQLEELFAECINKTIPSEVKETCNYCNGEKNKNEIKKCNNYFIEGFMNWLFAASDFVGFIEQNKHLINAEFLKPLTIKFYECFVFNKGRTYFNMEKLLMYCLKMGFYTFSERFKDADLFQKLDVINIALDEINSIELDYEMFKKEIPELIKPQKKFYKNQRKSVKEKLKTEKLKAISKAPNFKNKHPEWLKVGLKFADGTIKYETLGRPSFNEITKKAGLSETLRPYVSDTFQNSGTKNIFGSKKKMKTIYDHCVKNDIPVTDWFKNEYRKFK